MNSIVVNSIRGYQGWFNCEGDGSDLGWAHWTRNRRKPLGPGNVSVDLWPDVSEFDADELFETGFQHQDGSVAKARLARYAVNLILSPPFACGTL